MLSKAFAAKPKLEKVFLLLSLSAQQIKLDKNVNSFNNFIFLSFLVEKCEETEN